MIFSPKVLVSALAVLDSALVALVPLLSSEVLAPESVVPLVVVMPELL